MKNYIKYNNLLFDRLSVKYDRIELLLWFVRNKIVKIIGSDSKKILDLACGTGTLAIALARAGHDVLGLDLSARMLSVAQSKLTENLKCIFKESDETRIDISEDQFDVGVMSFALHDMPEQVALSAVSELSRVVKGEGCLIFIDYRKPTNFIFGWLVLNVPLIWESKYFSNFMKKGLDFYLFRNNLSVANREVLLLGFIEIIVCKKDS